MIANDFREHIKPLAGWVDWDNTVDQFMHGDPQATVRGIACTWLATDPVLQRASEKDLNFVIAHEGIFYEQLAHYRSEKKHHAAKRKLIDRLGITIMRCHDTWDRFPSYGVADTWADYLGFPTEPRQNDSFYVICDVSGMTGLEVAQVILSKVQGLGQDYVNMMGNLSRKVDRLAVGTGAITRLPEMRELGADLLLATDDGLHTTYNGLYSVDQDIPVIVVNHPTAELPGIQAMIPYIQKHFPGVPVEYLPCGFPYRILK
jgi:putative NIF3 family GTP cyclohydrolase 1 type 2